MEKDKSAEKLESLKEFIRLQALLEPAKKDERHAKASVPVLLMDSEVVELLLKQIANINMMLDRLAKRPSDQWLTHEQALEFFGVSENTLRGYVNSGWLACTQLERKKYFRMSDIEKFLMHPERRNKAFQLGE